MQGAIIQGVARGSTSATSRRSAPCGSRLSTESSGFTASKTGFGSPTPGSAPAAPAPATPGLAASTPALRPTEDLFRQYMQAYLEDRQNPAPAPAPAPSPADAREKTSERSLKARNPDLYYGNSDMECYYFGQKCKDHFDTAGAKGHKRVLFAVSFLKNRILYRRQKYKARTKRNQAVPLFWEKLKAFLRKSLGESNVCVGSVLSRMRGDSHYQLKESQDWAAHLEQLQSIPLEFDAACSLIDGQLGRTFYDGLRPSIKLWIEEVGRERLSWEELVTTANRAEAKADIYNNQHLDQRCPQGKRPRNLTFKESQEQPEK